MEVASYMAAGGVSMPHRYNVAPSSLRDESGKTDAEFTVRIAKLYLPSLLHLDFLFEGALLVGWEEGTCLVLGVDGKIFH